MTNHGDCSICELLWSQYLHATVTHLNLDNRLQHTSATRDREAAKDLTLQVRVAELKKEQGRKAIFHHNAETHSDEESRGSDREVAGALDTSA
jgi:hypothetical protein